MSHDIFISYSRRDAERMVQVRDTLRGADLQVWTDEGIEPGTESWKQSLSSAIKDCVWVVVLFSPDSASSTWVSRELDFAELHKKKIYPLLVRGSVEEAIPFGYTTFQFIDIREDEKVTDGLRKLIDTLHGRFDDSRNAAPAHPRVTESNETSVSSSSKVEASAIQEAKQEILWNWIETPDIRLTLPTTAKTFDPTDTNLQRVLHLLLGNDDSLLVRVLQSWDKLGFMYTGIRGAKMKPLLLFSDISGLSPFIGLVGEMNGWFFNPFNYLIAPYVIQVHTVVASVTEHFGAEVRDVKWTRSSGAPVVSGIGRVSKRGEDSAAVIYKVYGKIIPATRKPLLVVTSCEESRFASAESILDQIVKSMHYL